MASTLSGSLYYMHLLMSVCLVFTAEAQKIITAKLGGTVTLPCQVSSNTPFTVTEWVRPDLEPDYVLMYRDGQSDPDNQYPSFRDRVELKDSQMKSGDVSLVLKNVMINDNGTYECHVFQSGTHQRKRSTFGTEPINTITLTVSDSGDTAGHVGNEENKDGNDKVVPSAHVGVIPAVIVVLAVSVIVGMIINRKQHTEQNSEQLPAEQELQDLTVESKEKTTQINVV